MAEPSPAENLRASGVGHERLGESVADAFTQFPIFQTDKINHDPATEIAQADLAGDDLGGSEIDGKTGALR